MWRIAIMKTFGEIVKTTRKEKHILLRELASVTGISMTDMSRIENNYQKPTLDQCTEISLQLRLDQEEMWQLIQNTLTKENPADVYLENIKNWICPECNEKINQHRQAGRCVYADPCGHRLYQGKAMVKPKEFI